MTTKVAFNFRYPKSKKDVLRAFTDRSYFERKYAVLGCENIRVLDSRRESGKSFHIRVQMKQKSSSPVPSFAKKFLSEWQETIQRDAWNVLLGTGQINIDVVGVPAKINADMTIFDTDTGSQNDVTFTVSVKLPLVGAKLEKLIAQDIKAKAAADHEATLALLNDYS